MGPEDELIGEGDEGGTRFTFMVCLGSAYLSRVFRDTFIDDKPLGLRTNHTCASLLSLSAIPRATVQKCLEGSAKDAKYSLSRLIHKSACITAYSTKQMRLLSTVIPSAAGYKVSLGIYSSTRDEGTCTLQDEIAQEWRDVVELMESYMRFGPRSSLGRTLGLLSSQ